MVLNKNTQCFKIQTNSLADHMDGHQLVIQEIKDHIIALQVEMFALEELFVICTTKLVSMQESQFQEPMLKLCQDNGNSKLDHVSELMKEIICTWLDTFL